MPPTRVLPCSSGLAVLASQVYKEHSLWQNHAYRSSGTILTAILPNKIPRARGDVGSPFQGESNFVRVLCDFRAHQPRRSYQHRLQVPKTALCKSPGVAELRSYRPRFNLREFFTELLVLCFQFCELHP
jgi:hypothetical protein